MCDIVYEMENCRFNKIHFVGRIQTRQIDFRTYICIDNATGEIHREKQRAPHGFRRPWESVRSSTQRANIVEPTEEKSSRSIHSNHSIMYEDCETKVTTREGNTAYFNFFFFRVSSYLIVNSVCWSHALVNGPTSKRPAVCFGSPHSHVPTDPSSQSI